jgi:hypothetical protein
MPSNILQFDDLGADCNQGSKEKSCRHGRAGQLVRDTGLGFREAVFLQPRSQFLIGQISALQLGFEVSGRQNRAGMGRTGGTGPIYPLLAPFEFDSGPFRDQA